MNLSATIHRTRLVEMLASSVGEEKSRVLVEEVLAEEGLSGSSLLTEAQARQALERIARLGGIAAVAARLASARLTVGRAPDMSVPADFDLIAQLTPALGRERAVEQVTAACRRLGLAPTQLTREQAGRVLEVLSAEGGLVGVTARFMKARLLLST
ncbi:MAG: hypothetical protein RMJ98_14950 [Myxococcales bacterium]|nr:hypothetical protein [Polyangiaceae bacterium]MDW8250591.1 hypothetical protein [Myxococcales bacterium]